MTGQLWFKINGYKYDPACQDEILKLFGSQLFPTFYMNGKGIALTFINPTKKEMAINNTVRDYENSISGLIEELEMKNQKLKQKDKEIEKLT